jgi:hypothetical protein
MQVMTDYQQQAIDFLTATGAKLTFTYDGFKKYWDDDKQARNIFTWELTRGNKTIKDVFGASIADSCKDTPILQTKEPIEVYAGLSITFTYPKKHKLYFGFKIDTNCEVLNCIDEKEIVVDAIIDMTALKREYDNFANEYAEYRRKHKLGKESLKGTLSSVDSCKNYVEKCILKKIEELKSKTILLDQADNIVTPSAYDLLACLTKYDPGTFENFCGDFGYDTDSRKALKTYRIIRKQWRQLSDMFNEQELEALAEIS